ncbi:glycine betaine ABC transporter substrate-binding protein [Natrinema versiforme]|uniref:glycine betaine ABC transporter substrate-binding protein n=1 Tax=Natrinema versiforme TaxID=88724 RepID=UPI000677A882|nr:glycine betaine ABC transporter substrate-binding protein [Natrinema versiforme]
MVSTRRDVVRQSAAAATAVTTGAIAGCSSVITGSEQDIAVGSMQWSEAKLLGYMGYETLRENTDLSIGDETSLGGSMQCFEAVKSGEIALYFLYTGGAWATIPPTHDDVPRDPEELYERAKEEMREEHGLEYLQRATFDNTYALAVSPSWAEETGLETISEFAEYLNEGNTDVSVVLGSEFAERSDGWPGLAAAYGFESTLEDLSVQKVGASLTYQILGEEEADIGMVFTTNPQIKRYDLTVLDDDQDFFPAYNPAPLANGDVMDEYPEIEAPLNAVMESLDSEEKMIEINERVDIEDQDPQEVARDYLSEEGLI